MPSFECPLCHDFGSIHPVINGKADYSKLVTCTCQKERLEREQREWNMRFCNLPEDTRDKTFDTFRVITSSQSEALDCARRLAEGSEDIKWLTMISPVGRGKSHLAIAIARRWMERGFPVRYAFVPDMLISLRQGFERNDEFGYDAQFRMLCKIDLLILDDLCTERPTEWAVEQLQTIINNRLTDKLPMVVTTNRALNDLKGDDERRIGSRLRRERWCRVVVIDAPEYKQL